MQNDGLKEAITGMLKVIAVIIGIICRVIGVLVADNIYKLEHYGEPPVKVKEVTCVDIRYRGNKDMFIFEDSQGNRYSSRGLKGILKGDTAELVITGDNINYAYLYVINGELATTY